MTATKQLVLCHSTQRSPTTTTSTTTTHGSQTPCCPFTTTTATIATTTAQTHASDENSQPSSAPAPPILIPAMATTSSASLAPAANAAPMSYPARARSPAYFKENSYQPSSGSIGSAGARASAATVAAAAANARSSTTSNNAVPSGSASAISDKQKRSLDGRGHRRRSSSLVQVEKIEQTHEQLLDQSAGYNYNADWVNYKGAWVIHVVLILIGKILLDVIPGMEQDTSWTIVNLGYMALSYLMFHYVTGVPFENNAGVYDELTLWEQIDEGAQYTPAKKWLTSVPIGLFLISTHYTRYNPALFSLNFCALLFVLFPKLPILHRLRFKFQPFGSASMPPTPTPSRPSSAASFR